LDEQQFLTNLLFKTLKVVDTIWIGAKYSNIKFIWTDNSDLSFTNWAAGSPSNNANKGYVQMMPDGSLMGKWADELCTKKNLIVCERMQSWVIFDLQKSLLASRKKAIGLH